ncbi:MAG TPA: sugar ABC transporter ATP-binding protein [Acidiphilium sp.]|nr:sugar ABC transporter ATP-binding protein [Acidiphilium sp.]
MPIAADGARRADGADAASAPTLSAVGLSKRFGGVVALRRADLALYPGEVHALLGANGAGKSTLVKLLAGIEQPDEGTITVGGTAMRFASPHAALAAGIATVHQELSLFPSLSVAENILIGQEKLRGGHWIDAAAMRERARDLLEMLGASDIDPDATVGDLPLAQAQLVEIAKALSTDPRVLILDEPTSALSIAEVDHLMTVIERLRDRGTAIVLISHRLGEIERLADRVSILRSGEKVGEFPPGDFSRDKALALMLGEAWQERQEAAAAYAGRPDDTILRVDGLTLAPHFTDIGFELRRGEVLGLAGLEGQGQKEFLFALFGLFRRGLEGIIEVGGKALRPRQPRDAIAAGIAMIPDDRKTLGGFLGLSIAENIAITVLGSLRRGLLLSRRAEADLVDDYVRRLGIKCSSGAAPLGSLSGGNQQKVVVAKWLARRMPVYVFCDPTRGVDAGARRELFGVIRDLAAQGTAVLFYSTDISEFPLLCHRVLVFREGRVSGSLEGAAITEQNILDLSFHEAAHEAA